MHYGGIAVTHKAARCSQKRMWTICNLITISRYRVGANREQVRTISDARSAEASIGLLRKAICSKSIEPVTHPFYGASAVPFFDRECFREGD